MNGFEKRTQEKKQRVLNTTFNRMNSEMGIANVTIEEVAKEAGVGKTSIFNYFGSKEQLIQEVFKQFLTEMRNAAREIMTQHLPFEETMIAMSQNKIKYLEGVHKQFYLDLMDFYTDKNNGSFSKLMEEYTNESFSMMLDLFHQGRKEGKVDIKYSDEFLLLYFQALVEGIASPLIYEKILPYTPEWTEVLIKGLAPSNK
ncbi:TetR/AcrR family transcriptional regulator [Enterococcus hirae]|nr:TetR/AcrR family transcriptional regulator [Enterococcus hirae]